MNNYSIKEYTYGGRVGPRVGSGRVRLFVGNRGSGRVKVSPGRVGSGPRKVTRGQLWESISRSFTKLSCLGDLKNQGQLPVSQAIEGTADWVLWNFVISSFPTFSRSRNPFLAVSQSYHFRVTSEI